MSLFSIIQVLWTLLLLILLILSVYYFVILLGFMISALVVNRFKRQRISNKNPAISIVIPAYNEELNIKRCLHGIISSTYDRKQLEIIVVDDRSIDKTRKIVNEFKKKYKNIQIIKGDHQGKAIALNNGIRVAKNDLVLTIDADVELHKEYLRNIVQAFTKKEVGFAFGLLHCTHANSFLGYLQWVEFCTLNLIRGAITQVTGVPFGFNGQAVCFRRSALLSVGSFDNDTLTEDFDLSLKLYHAGYKAAFVPEAISYTQPLRVKALFRQRMRWRYGGIQTVAKHWNKLRLNRPMLLFVVFSHLLTLCISVVSLIRLAYTAPTSLLTEPYATLSILFSQVSGIGYLVMSEDIMNPNVVVIISLFLCVTINSLLLLGILITGKQFSWRISLAVILYSLYAIFLQFCFVCGIIKYRFQKNLSFVKE